MKRNNLACDSIHSDLEPLFVGFFLYEIPHLIRFGFELV
jgi:hypothetical protein